MARTIPSPSDLALRTNSVELRVPLSGYQASFAAAYVGAVSNPRPCELRGVSFIGVGVTGLVVVVEVNNVVVLTSGVLAGTSGSYALPAPLAIAAGARLDLKINAITAGTQIRVDADLVETL